MYIISVCAAEAAARFMRAEWCIEVTVICAADGKQPLAAKLTAKLTVQSALFCADGQFERC